MKKLMFAMAAIAAGVAVADVTSANVVGYMNVERPSQYRTSGSMFLTPGQISYKLQDFKILDADADNDIIQFIQPTKALLDNSKSYFYYEDGEDSCWCYAFGAAAGDPVEEDVIIPAGTAFLCNFKSSSAKLVYAGEVDKGKDGLITIPRAGLYSFYTNPLPYPVDLTLVKLENANADEDVIQFILPNKALLDNARSYFYYEDGEDSCWCYAFGAAAGDPIEEGDEIIAAGDGFLGKFTSTNVKVVFPAPKL